MLPCLDVGAQARHPENWFYTITALDMVTQDGHPGFEWPALLPTLRRLDAHTIICLLALPATSSALSLRYTPEVYPLCLAESVTWAL